MRLVIYCLMFLIILSPLFADEIEKKDGTIIKGKIVRIHPEGVEIELQGENTIFEINSTAV